MDDAHEVKVPVGRTKAWSWLGQRPRAVLGAQDRHRIVEDLYPEAGEVAHWWFRFSVMLALSVMIAVLGLSMDSDAVVIGAMLVAPLMTPIIGTAAALVMGWPRRLAQSGLAVLAGSAAAVGISYVLTLLLPTAGQGLTGAVLSRTSPDLRDLVVALAAGAAAAYATVREDLSAALPGTAVAVALVPPLSAAGYTLAIGREDLTGGAILLFVANLVAIVLISSIVLVGSGFVPAGRIRAASGRIRFGLLSSAIAVAVVATPLTRATLASDSHAQTTQAVNQAAVAWLAPYPSLTLTGATISGTLVTVSVTGSTSPPPPASLAKSLTGVLGPSVKVQVRWVQTTSATSTTSTTSPRNTAPVPLTLAQIQPIVESWLANGASTAQITQLSTSNDSVSVELEGSSAPPPANQLAQTLSKLADQTVTVSVTWRTPAPATAPTPGPANETQQAQAVVSTWLTTHPGIQVLGITVADGVATIDLAGSDRALVTPDLWTALSDQLGPNVQIVIRFARLNALKP